MVKYTLEPGENCLAPKKQTGALDEGHQQTGSFSSYVEVTYITHIITQTVAQPSPMQMAIENIITSISD